MDEILFKFLKIIKFAYEEMKEEYKKSSVDEKKN